MKRIISLCIGWFVLVGSFFPLLPVQATSVLSDSLLSYYSSTALVPVIVELQEPCIIDHPLFLESRSFLKVDHSDGFFPDLSHLQRQLVISQNRWVANLQRKPISFFYQSSCQYIGNFVSLLVKGSDLVLLSKQPNVKSIMLDWEEEPFRKTMSLSTGANKVWNGSITTKASGKGIRMGIIDSGIDYDHPEFEKKIVKGVDFTQDENFKEDGIGHGTHVAGISAGLGSSQYGKGMAFDGLLYVYKVFPKEGGGSAGSDIYQALDTAVSDQCQIVNLSLGHVSDAKAKEGNMYHSIIQKLIKANVFVVAAVGNSGARGKEVPWPAGSPGVVEDSFCVAATNDRKFNPSFFSEDHSFPYSVMQNSLTGEKIELNTSDLYHAHFGKPEDYQDGRAEGKYILIERGPVSDPLSFSEKYSIALQHKPKGIMFYAKESIPALILTELNHSILQSEIKLPVFMIKKEDALVLLSKSAKLQSSFYFADDGISIADFSSMGPSSDGIFKPEIAAPGVDILSTFLKKYGGYAAASGTSMATPSMTGLIALVKELKPDWKINQIKSAFMNNADILFNPVNQEPITFTLQGAGHARVDKAIQTEAFLTPRAFIVEEKSDFTQEIIIQNAKSTELIIPSIKAEIFGLAKDDIIQIQVPARQINIKPTESTKVTVHFVIQRELFRRSKYEGMIWINQMHIPFIIYKDTTEKENQTAVKNPISDLQIEKTDLFSCDMKTTNRIEFAFNTGSEQKFEGQIQYSNFGTIRLFLCDNQGLEWISKPIVELKQCPVGCYAYEWKYQDYIRENNIPNGTYRIKIVSSASQSFELLSESITIFDSPEPTLGTLFLGIPKYQIPESKVILHLSAFMNEDFDEIEYTLYYDDSRLNIESVTLDPSIQAEEPPVMKSNYIKITIPSKTLPNNKRFSIASIQAFTSKKLGSAPFSHRILVKSPSQKQKVRIHGFLPELTLTKKGELNCDVNKDGKTDMLDFFAFSKKLGFDYSSPEYESVNDFNQDKSIDMIDYDIWLKEAMAD